MRRRGAQGKELDLGILGITIPPGALRPISTVIFWCAAWAIVFGFVFGEFFGNVLEKWPANNPVFYIAGEAHGEDSRQNMLLSYNAEARTCH